MRKTYITAALFVVCAGSAALAEQPARAPAPEPCSLLCILKGGPQQTTQPAQPAAVAASAATARSGFRRATHRRAAKRRPVEVVEEEIEVIPLRRASHHRRWRHAAHVRYVASSDREAAEREPKALWSARVARTVSRPVASDEPPSAREAPPSPPREAEAPPIEQEREALSPAVSQETKPANPFGGLSLTGLK